MSTQPQITSATELNYFSRIFGAYLLGAGAVFGILSIRNIKNVRPYNLLLNIASVCMVLGSLVMTCVIALIFLGSPFWPVRITVINTILYSFAYIFLYESLHIRAFVVLGTKPLMKVLVWIMRIFNIGNVVASLCVNLYLLSDSTKSTGEILSHPLYTTAVKLIEVGLVIVGFAFYSTLDYLTVRVIAGYRGGKVKKQAKKFVLTLIFLTMIFRMADFILKAISITGKPTPLDYYIHEFDIVFTIWTTRKCQNLIKAITDHSDLSDGRSGSANASHSHGTAKEYPIPMQITNSSNLGGSNLSLPNVVVGNPNFNKYDDETTLNSAYGSSAGGMGNQVYGNQGYGNPNSGYGNQSYGGSMSVSYGNTNYATPSVAMYGGRDKYN